MAHLSHLPLRLVSGSYILNSGIGKRGADGERAAALHGQATRAFPAFSSLDPVTFVRGLSAGEMALGAALLAPFVPSWAAGAGLLAFSSGLLRLYIRSPEAHRPGSVRPTPQGSGLAKDVWLAGIGAALLLDSFSGRGSRR